MDTAPAKLEVPAGELYDASYYASHCGPVPYARNDHWLQFFGRVSDELVRAFAPRRVFDAGCALGLLVESFWDRGVEAYGRDLSEFAIGQIRADIRPCCSAGSIADPIDGEFDLLTCIEVLEHMPEAAALEAIQAMAAASPRILFSSSPTDLDEPTHCNVRPPIYWLARWAEAGFAPNPEHDAAYLAPHAYVLERSETGRTPRDITAFADRIRHRVAMAQLGNRLSAVTAESQQRANALQALQTAAAERDSEHARALARVEAELQTARQALILVGANHESLQADHAAERARLKTESARLRASAARRTMEARADAGDVRRQLAALELSARDASVELAALRARARGAEAEIAAANSRVAALGASEAQLQHRLATALSQRDTLLRSTAWRATWPLRRLASAVPAPLRGAARNSLTTGWWIVTGQLRTRLRQRRQPPTDADILRQTPLFHPQWYLARNPDVHLSGMDPAVHYAFAGGREGRDPGPHFSVERYYALHPQARDANRPALMHFLETGRDLGWDLPEPAVPDPAPMPPATQADPPAPAPEPAAPAPEMAAPEPTLPDLHDLLGHRFAGLEPLRTYPAPHDAARVTIVTDSINSGSLYGGVGTALILAALLARRLGAGLRLVTRTEAPAADNIGALLATHGIDWSGNIDLIHAPPRAGRDVPVGKRDIFLTTSWWTTWATRHSVDPSQIVYLLQEDERGFYPLGDDHLRCTETLSDPALTYVVNSSLLMGHFEAEALAPGGIAFEPAFPPSAYHAEDRAPSGKSNFFFYARPNNPRNLFWRGVEAIGAAMEEGVLDPASWEINFVGRDVPALRLPGGVQPIVSENMAWSDYASLVRRMDLGLSLMDTPHPSYPPLDLAASGAVVVTNQFGRKTSLQGFSPNIVCVQSTVPALVDGLRRAKTLATDGAARQSNYAANGLQRDWAKSLLPVLDRIAAQYGA